MGHRPRGLVRQDDHSVYVNFLGDEGEERSARLIKARHGTGVVEIKHRYDPTNLFRLNENIPPG